MIYYLVKISILRRVEREGICSQLEIICRAGWRPSHPVILNKHQSFAVAADDDERRTTFPLRDRMEAFFPAACGTSKAMLRVGHGPDEVPVGR